jgi:hypothetical protein
MDGSRFDALSRALADVHSRRSLPRFLGGLTLAGSLGLLNPNESTASRRKRHKRHKRHKHTTPSSPPCTPSCAGKQCGDDGCAGSCGTCPPESTCVNGFLTTNVCQGGTCQPATFPCGIRQVCYQNICCTRRRESDCHQMPEPDNCGGTYPANCGGASHCCSTSTGEVCYPAPGCPP